MLHDFELISFLVSVKNNFLFRFFERKIRLFDIGYGVRSLARCRISDDQMSDRSYPLLAAREPLQIFIREPVHEHQAA